MLANDNIKLAMYNFVHCSNDDIIIHNDVILKKLGDFFGRGKTHFMLLNEITFCYFVFY